MDYMTKLVKAAMPQGMKRVLRSIMLDFQERRFKPYIRKKNVEGVFFDFWIGDTVGRDWYDLQCTDPDWFEMRFIRDYLIQPGDVVFDCGAHHGCTATVFSNWVGDKGKIIAFEPVPKNCNIIQKNIELNKLKNVILERKAVGAKKGMIYVKECSNSRITIKGGGKEVGMIYLDEYAHLNPTFIKVDVQGFEVEVLRGAKNILATRPKLDIEIHLTSFERYNTSVEELFSLIDIFDYNFWLKRQDENEANIYDMKNPITKRIQLFGQSYVHLFALPKQ